VACNSHGKSKKKKEYTVFVGTSHWKRIQNSSVGIATGYGLDDRGVGVRVPVGSRIFSTSSRPALGLTHPPIEWVPGALSPGREADHSPPTSAEGKKMWI
jgi:hypothetical protein